MSAFPYKLHTFPFMSVGVCFSLQTVHVSLHVSGCLLFLTNCTCFLSCQWVSAFPYKLRTFPFMSKDVCFSLQTAHVSLHVSGCLLFLTNCACMSLFQLNRFSGWKLICVAFLKGKLNYNRFTLRSQLTEL